MPNTKVCIKNITMLLCTMLALCSFISYSYAKTEQQLLEDKLEDQYIRWTYYQEAKLIYDERNEYTVTFMAPSLINAWYNYEQDPFSKERIKKLHDTVVNNGYSVYVIGIKISYASTLDIAPIKNNVTLGIVEKKPRKYSPIAFSNNIEKIFGINNNTYYGVLAFDTPQDFFSFQTITLKGTWSKYSSNSFDKVRDSGVHTLQFTFFPNGVPTDIKKITQRNVNTEIDFILGLLDIAINIIALIV